MNNVCAAHQEVKEQLRDHEKRIIALEKALFYARKEGDHDTSNR